VRPRKYLCLAAGALVLIGCGGGDRSPTLTPTGITPSPPVATVKTATLNWSQPTLRANGDPLNQVTGYTVYYGAAEDNLNQMVLLDDPTVTSYTTPDLEAGTYYFTVTATDGEGREGRRAPLVSKVVD